MSQDFIKEAKRRVAHRSSAEAYALIAIAEDVRLLREFLTAPPIVYTFNAIEEDYSYASRRT